MLQMKKFTRRLIDIECINVDNKHSNVREWTGDKTDYILLRSIKTTGRPIHDIIVKLIPTKRTKKRKTKKQYCLVVGARRLEAMKKAGIKRVYCIIINNLTELDVMTLSFAENIGRKDFTDFQKMNRVLDWLKLLINSKIIGNETEDGMKKIRRESIQEIANSGFGGKSSDVYRILQTANLPMELQTFIKEPGEKIKKEKNLCKKHGIKPDFKMDFKTMGIIKKIVDYLGGAPPVEKTERIFGLIKDFGLDNENYKNRNRVLRRVRDKLKQKSFENVEEEVKKELNISPPNLDPAKFIHYEIPNEYMNLHVKAVRQQNIKSTTLARKVYLQWLEDITKEDEKIQELEAELNRLKSN